MALTLRVTGIQGRTL